MVIHSRAVELTGVNEETRQPTDTHSLWRLSGKGAELDHLNRSFSRILP